MGGNDADGVEAHKDIDGEEGGRVEDGVMQLWTTSLRLGLEGV
jgi:hypothetical protein